MKTLKSAHPNSKLTYGLEPLVNDELLDVIAAAVGRIEVTVTKTAVRVDVIERDVAVLKTDVAEVKRDVSTIARRIEKHETRIGTLEARS